MSKTHWRALDHCDCNTTNNNADVVQGSEQIASTTQQSYEWIVVKDSEGVTVTTTDNQAALNLQVAIQAAIAIVITIAVGSTDAGNSVVQELKQFFKTKQRNTQKTIIEGSRTVNVTTTDNQIAVNIQALIQILVAIVARLEVL